jgi:quercetin dioxygenase-like cupin family protein
MSEQTIQAPAPALVTRSDAEARWWLGMLAEIKATAADTGGQYTLVEVTCPPGFEAPLHVHHREDEAFVVLEGSARLRVGEDTFDVSAGDYALGPRDIPHAYTVGDAGCRMLFLCTPGGLENLVREMSEPAGSRTLPSPADEPPDLERMAAIAAANGCELIV